MTPAAREQLLRGGVAYAIRCWVHAMDIEEQERHRRWLQRMVGARVLAPEEGQS